LLLAVDLQAHSRVVRVVDSDGETAGGSVHTTAPSLALSYPQAQPRVRLAQKWAWRGWTWAGCTVRGGRRGGVVVERVGRRREEEEREEEREGAAVVVIIDR
jgi:hypothetical protein